MMRSIRGESTKNPKIGMRAPRSAMADACSTSHDGVRTQRGCRGRVRKLEIRKCQGRAASYAPWDSTSSVAKPGAVARCHESDVFAHIAQDNIVSLEECVSNAGPGDHMLEEPDSILSAVSHPRQPRCPATDAKTVKVIHETLGSRARTLKTMPYLTNRNGRRQYEPTIIPARNISALPRQGPPRQVRLWRKIALRSLTGEMYSKRWIAKRRIVPVCPHSHMALSNGRRQTRAQRRVALGTMLQILNQTIVSAEGHHAGFSRNPSFRSSLQTNSPRATRKKHALRGFGYNHALGSVKRTRLQKAINTSNVLHPRYHIPRHTTPLFRPSARLQRPHPGLFTTEPKLWNDSVNVSTNAPRSCREGGQSGEATGSSSNHQDSRSNPQADPARPPNDRNSQSTQTPNDSMKQASGEDMPSESESDAFPESESEPEQEVDQEEPEEEPEEEHIALTFQIPPETLEQALQAPPKTRASYWSQKLYRGPDDEEITVHYCSNMEVSERVAKHFVGEKVLGFDIEWKVFGAVDSIKENASLIQIANEDRIALFHIARFPGKTSEELLPPTLKAILEAPETLKVGVAVKGDVSRLQKHLNLNISGIFELSRLHNLVEYFATDPKKVSNKLVSLTRQVNQHLLLPLYKGEPLIDEPLRLDSVRESDWTKALDFEQIQYAAADAYAGFRLFDALEAKRKKMKPAPPIPLVCDYDNRPTPRNKKPPKAKKAKSDIEAAIAEALSGLPAEDPEEEIYETAAEDFSQDGEDEAEPEPESASESSDDSDYDPDADYVPKRGRSATKQSLSDAQATAEPRSRRIGRVSLSKFGVTEPLYPKLPTLSTDAESSSDESDAFDPLSITQSRGRGRDKDVATELRPEEESNDEFADPELEKDLMTLHIGDNVVDAEGRSMPAVDEQPDVHITNVDSHPTPPDNEPSPTTPATSTSTSTTHTPEFTLATTWASDYLVSTIPPPTAPSTSRIRATLPPLRAYHLWHVQRIPLASIGAHLRDPPLAHSTVSNYILQAVVLEKLEYRKEEMGELVLGLPVALRLGKYKWLARRVGVVR